MISLSACIISLLSCEPCYPADMEPEQPDYLDWPVMITKANDHKNATPVIRDAWLKVWGREGTPKEILYSQAIASYETGYGRLNQFAQFAKEGKFNWGAEQRKPNADGTCPPNFVLGKDQGNVCFYYFPSDVEAAAAFLKTLTKSPLRPDTVAAMAGTPEDVARAMRGPHPPQGAYYAGLPTDTEEQKIQRYADGIRARAKDIGAALSNGSANSTTPITPPSNQLVESPSYLGYSALIAGMAGAAWLVSQNRITKVGK